MEQQLDLFAGSGAAPDHQAPVAPPLRTPHPAELSDVALLAALPASRLADGPLLAAEAGRRRLSAAVPALESYCRRFAGFGTRVALPEQVAALEALAVIGGTSAADSVARIIDRGWVQGPTLASAVAAAARLRARLPVEIVLALLRHADPKVRADACRLARPGPGIVATLADLLGDLNREVCIEAACALGRIGCRDALPTLKHALRQAPSLRVIEAVPAIADDECIVLLGRLARGVTGDLAAAARDALEATDHPLAPRLLTQLRQA